jgi:hypothetical protein
MKRILAAVMMSVILSVVGTAATSSNKMMSKKEVKALLANASTPADHNRLAEHYLASAEKLDAEAKEHAEMAATYRARPTASEVKRPGAADTARHCELLSEDLAKAAKEARTLAQAHADMAKK